MSLQVMYIEVNDRSLILHQKNLSFSMAAVLVVSRLLRLNTAESCTEAA